MYYHPSFDGKGSIGHEILKINYSYRSAMYKLQLKFACLNLLIISFFFSSSLTLNCATAEDVGTITIRADSWPPFNADPNDPLPGYGIEILKAIFEKQGYKIDYQLMPWTRALEEVKSGKYDGAIGAAVDDARDFVFPSEPIAVITNTFFAKKGSTWTYAGLSSLEKIKLGTIESYPYTPEIDEYVNANKKSDKVQAVSGDNAVVTNIKKLQAGRIDVVLECPQVMNWTLKTMGIAEGDVVPVGKVEQSDQIFVAFSPAKPESKKYAEMLSDGIKQLRASGELKKILDKYNAQDWQ